MTDQQKSDYYYGYNLRLADELGEYDGHIQQPIHLEDKVKLCNNLKQKLWEKYDQDTPVGKQQRMEMLVIDIFNDPVHEIEQEYYTE